MQPRLVPASHLGDKRQKGQKFKVIFQYCAQGQPGLHETPSKKRKKVLWIKPFPLLFLLLPEHTVSSSLWSAQPFTASAADS